MLRGRRILVRVFVMMVALCCALGLLSWWGFRAATTAGESWRLALDDAADLTAAGGAVYTYSWESVASGWTVQRLDPTTGEPEQTWEHPSLARPSITPDGGLVYIERDRAHESGDGAGADRSEITVSQYSADDTMVWSATFATALDPDGVRAIAAREEAVDIVACDAANSQEAPHVGWFGEHDQLVPCRLRTITGAGEVSGAADVLLPPMLDERTPDLGAASATGYALPAAVPLMRDRERLSLHRPGQALETGWDAELPIEDIDTAVLTPTHFITAQVRALGDNAPDAGADGGPAVCVLRGFSLAESGRSWESEAEHCRAQDIPAFRAVRDPDAMLYFAAIEGGSFRIHVLAIDEETGATQLADDSLFGRDPDPLSRYRYDLEDLVIGQYAVNRAEPGALAGTPVTATGNGSPTAFEADYTGTLLYADAAGESVAMLMRVDDRRELPWWQRANPWLRADDLQRVAVFDASDPGAGTARLTTTPIAKLYLVDDPDGTGAIAVSVREDGEVSATPAPVPLGSR